MSWSALIVVSFLIGSAVLSLAEPNAFSRAGDRFLLAVWMGSLTVAIALLAASLLGPLTAAVSLLVMLVLLSGASMVPSARLALRHGLQVARGPSILGFGALLIGVAFYSSQPVSFYDTGLYHAGAIEWLSRFGSVKGLALLEWRLGFTSSWFALAGAFNTWPLSARSETLMGGYAVLLASAHFVISLVRLARGDGRVSDWFAALAYLVVVTWLIRSGITISPSPDVPVIVVSVVVMWSIVVLAGERGASRGSAGPNKLLLLRAEAVPAMLAAGAISLKLSTAPLLVVAVVFYLWAYRPGLQLLTLGGVSGLLVLPSVLASLLTSGCPLFPSPFLCTELPWSVGGPATAAEQLVGRDFLRWTGPSPPNASSWNWIPHWLSSEPLGALLIGCMLLASIAVPLAARRLTAEASVWVLAFAWVGFLFVMVFSPTYRFLLPYAVVAPAYLGAVVCARLRLHPFVLLPPMVAALGSVATVTITDFHSNGFTRSAIAYAAILPVGALAIGVGFFAPKLIERWPYAALPLRGLQYPALGALVGALFAISNLSLIPRPWVHQRPAAGDYLSYLVEPPLLPTLAANEQIQLSVNDFAYVSPKPGLQVCWAVVPCTTEPLPSGLHLLDPKRGIAGGFVRG